MPVCLHVAGEELAVGEASLAQQFPHLQIEGYCQVKGSTWHSEIASHALFTGLVYPCCVASGKSLHLSGLSFVLCKMGQQKSLPLGMAAWVRQMRTCMGPSLRSTLKM